MSNSTKSLLRTLMVGLLSGTCIAGTSSPSENGKTISAPAALARPITLSLEARTVENDAAFGLHLVRPVFERAASTVLIEGYGFEGEGDLGLAGGGVIYRQQVGSRSAFEASAFFEGLRSTDGFAYPQLGAGVAFRPDRWLTLRANGYLPLRGKDSRRTATEQWTRTEGSATDLREAEYSRERFSERAPMRGFDVEAELRLSEPPRWVDPRIAIGYSYREAEDRPEVYAGVTARGELHFAKHWVAEAEWRNDAQGAGQEWRVGVRFQMLFGREGRDEGREDERYLPVQRFPWPTVARGLEHGKTRRGNSRALAPSQPQPAAPVDCCNSGNAPLVFE